MKVVFLLFVTLGLLSITYSRPVSISVVAYLVRYGYLDHGEESSDDELREGLLSFQHRNKLLETGTMTSETRALMSQPRCGFRDVGEPQQSLLRFAWAGSKWLSTSLTYSFLNYTTDLPESDTREAIEAAFEVWSDVSPLRFTEVDPSDNPDINILFNGGEHGDNDPFDGPLGVLAHAFYPGPGFGGDAHFDEAENFTINGGPGIDLFQVAAHEFGHSLGLNHSSDPTALMWPYYQYISNFMLPQDDIDGIQYIYGPNPDAPSTTAVPDNENYETSEDCLCIRHKPDI